MSRSATDLRDLRHELAGALRQARDRTLALVTPLDDDELHDQPIDFLSPLVWDVGHIACIEELWLVRELTGRPSSDPARDELYDAFENPRWVRGELPLLPRQEALTYLADVRKEALRVLRDTELAHDAPLLAEGRVHRMIAQHESQHQETMLQALALRRGGHYLPDQEAPPPLLRPVDDTDRVEIPGGPVTIGTDDTRWTYDNERPAHRVEVAGFALDRFPVTARRYAAFIADGGYVRPELWSERGWEWRQEAGHEAPQGWEPAADRGWRRRRFGQLEPVDPREPVQHVSYLEAEAFARWAGGRLPTEIEWEKAAGWDPVRRRSRRFPWGDAAPTPERANVGMRRFGPQPVGSFPAGASAYGVEQLAGDVYEWTGSPLTGYPGFLAFPYRGYSEVFFGGDYRVLRGASWAVPAPFTRVTYRNWDHPYRRQIFAGLRVAYDLPR